MQEKKMVTWEELRTLLHDTERIENETLYQAWTEIGGFICDQAMDSSLLASELETLGETAGMVTRALERTEPLDLDTEPEEEKPSIEAFRTGEEDG